MKEIAIRIEDKVNKLLLIFFLDPPLHTVESMANAGFVKEMMREQSVLEATCGDLFDHIDDLLDLFKESAADVLLLDALSLTRL